MAYEAPDGVVQNSGETPLQTYQRYFANYHSPNRDQVLADTVVWVQQATIACGAPPAGIVANPNELPLQTQARYVADYHSPDRAAVLASIAVWIAKGVQSNAGPSPIGGQQLAEPPNVMQARFIADYHSPDAPQVIAILTKWARGLVRPDPPSRMEALCIHVPFQGVYITSKRYSADYQAVYGGNGQIPFYAADIQDFAAVGELDDVLDQIESFDTVMAYIRPGGEGYNEGGQPYGRDQIIQPANMWGDHGELMVSAYIPMVDHIIERGKKLAIIIWGEGQEGFDWILANFQQVVTNLRTGYDRIEYGTIIIAFDGVWPEGWTVPMVKQAIPFMRGILGNTGTLGMFFANGPSNDPYLWVETEADYDPDITPWMDGLDMVCLSSSPNLVECPNIANNACYFLREPNFDAAGCQPDRKGPFIFFDCTRGPRVWCNIESAVFQTLRDANQAWKARVDAGRVRQVAIGCMATG